MARLERTLIVQAPVDRVYHWWATWEHLPAVMPRLRQVKKTGPLATHWEAEGPDGQLLAWEAAITHDMPQRLLAWESRGPVRLKGQVEFEALSGDRTRLTVTLSTPDNSAAEAILGDLDEALSAFKAAMEAEPPVPPLPVAYPYRDLFYKAMAATAGVLVVAGLAWGLMSLMEIWMILLGALLLGATLSPAVAFLGRWMPRGAAVSLTYLAVAALAGVVLLVLVPGIMTQGQELAGKLPGYAADLQDLLTRLHEKHRFIPEGNMLMGYMADQASTVLGNAFSLTTRFIWLLVVVLSVLFLSLFMLLDGPRLQSTLIRVVPIPQKTHIPALLHTVQERVGQYMLGVAFICGLAGVVTWAVLSAMGVPYALLIGATTSLLQVVPFIGALFGGAIAGAIALSKSPEAALWTLVAYAIIQQIIGQFLFPLIMGRTIGMHPVWVMLAILIGGTLYGLVGAFVAIPIAIAVSIVLECYYVPWAEAKAGEGNS